MEIKVDVQKDKATDIEHKRDVCPPLWLRDVESKKSNLQQAAVLRQQMPEVHQGGTHRERGAKAVPGTVDDEVGKAGYT